LEVEPAQPPLHIQHLATQIKASNPFRLHRLRVDFIKGDSARHHLSLFQQDRICEVMLLHDLATNRIARQYLAHVINGGHQLTAENFAEDSVDAGGHLHLNSNSARNLRDACT